MSSFFKSLTGQTLIATFAGILAGSFIFGLPADHVLKTFGIGYVVEILARVFISSLQLMVIPLVFVSLVVGVASLKDLAQLRRVSIKTIGIFFATTAIAVSIALGIALLVQPGIGLNLTTEASFQAKAPPAVVDVLASLVPKNPIEAMAKGEVLQVIFFAILFGIGLIKSGETGQSLRASFEKLNTVLLNLVELIVRFAPVGVFALLAKTFSTQGLSALSTLAAYFFTVLLVLIFHGWIFYPTLIYALAQKSPFIFLRKMIPVQLFAFSTSSSNATLPLNLETTEKKLGVENSIASFTIPLGATVNMDGTAIMQGVATVFIAQVFNVTLSVQDLAMVVLTATLASIGTAGVPGVGLIMLAMVLQQVNLPVEGIALILGVDRLLDMTRTAVNVTGDAMASVVVAKSENKLNHSVYDSDSSS